MILTQCRKTHKSRRNKLPYKMPLKVATFNIRGLNGENGVTKRQLNTKTMNDEELDVLLLTQTQVNSSSVETHNDYLFCFGSDIPPGRSDREHAGVAIVVHNRYKPYLYEVKQRSGRVMAIWLRSQGINLA